MSEIDNKPDSEIFDRLRDKDAEIAELRQQRNEASVLQLRAMHERDVATGHLGEILAVIHRDGGQYQAEHGAAKAVEDALSKLSSLRCELYDLQGEYEETAALFGAWKQRAEQAESERDEARKELAAEIAQTTVALARYAAAHDQAERERDEARECVKRLWQLVNEHTDCLRAEADAALLDRKRRGYLAELAVVEAALAATPEHLR